MTDNNASKVVKMIMFAMILQLFVVGYVLWQSYQGRVDLVKSEQAGCERSKLDRNVNALGWRDAESTRVQTLSQELKITYRDAQLLLDQKPRPDDPPDLTAARKYDGIATSLEVRGAINCMDAFPNASLLP